MGVLDFPIEPEFIKEIKRRKLTAAEADPFGFTVPTAIPQISAVPTPVPTPSKGQARSQGIPFEDFFTRYGEVSQDVLRGLLSTGIVEPPIAAEPDILRAGIGVPTAQPQPAEAPILFPVTTRDVERVGKLLPAEKVRELGRRGGFGEQPRTDLDITGALEHIIAPLDVLAETAFSLVKLEKPKGYTRALENFRDRSILVQMALGVAFDPLIVLGVLGITTRASRGVIAVAVRAELSKNLPNVSKRILDSAVELTSRRLRDALANERGGTFLGPDIPPLSGPAGLPPVRQADRLKMLEEFGLVVDSSANEFAAPLRSIEDVVAEVVTVAGVRGQALGLAVGPSVSRTSDVGKLATAAQRQKIAVDELVSTAMAASFDSHLSQFRQVLPIDPRTGTWRGANVPWQRVFEAPDKFSKHVTEEARALIDDVNQMTNQETNRLLEDAGITRRLRDRPADEYYVPRNVEEIRGIETRRGSDPSLRLHYDDITEGLAAGVDYGTDPRQDIELYMRWVYGQVAKKQLDDALVDSSVTRTELIPPEILTRFTDVADSRKVIESQRRKLRRSILAAEGQPRTALEKVRGRTRAVETTQSDIAQLDAVIDDLGLLPFEDAPTVPIIKGAEKIRTSQLGRAAQSAKNLGRIKTREAAQSRGRMTAKQAAEGIEARVEFLRAQVDNIDERLDAINSEFRLAKIELRRTMEELRKAEIAPGALWGPNQPLEIPIKAWRNRFFPLEDAELLEAALGPASNAEGLTKAFQTIANSRRFLAAVGDFAMPFIQGLPVLATNPVAWGRMSARHYQAFFDPGVQSRLIRDNITDYQWLAQHGVPIGDPEFFAALVPGQGLSASMLFKILPKGDEIQRLARLGGKQTFGRFQASYNTGLGWARVQLLKALQESWQGTDAELAQYIRNLTGGLDSRALGVGPSRRAAEGMWMAFSPRLLRSTIALTKDALNPTTQVGRRSLRSLAVLASGATTTYVLTGLALGKDWDEIKTGLNPLNGKRYLSYQINGDWIGVGGQLRAISQMIAGIAVDPVSLTATSRRDNPILNFLSSRGAPGAQILLQAGEAGAAVAGGEVNLDPFEQIDGPIDFLTHLGKGSLPFTLQGIMEGEQGLTSMFALSGLRTSPETPFDRLREARTEAKKQLGITTDDDKLDSDQKRDIDDLVPQEIKDEASKARLDFGSKTEVLKLALKEVDDRVNAQIAVAADGLGAGEAFRKRLTALNTERAIAKDQEREGDQHAEARQFFEELEPSEAIFDRAIDAYFAAVTDERLESEFGDFNFDLRERLLKVVRQAFGEETFDKVETFVHENEHPLAKELREDREALKPYWDIPETYVQRKLTEREWEIYNAWLNQTKGEKANIVEHPEGRAVVNKGNRWKRLYQREAKRQNPDIASLLNKWEYSVSRETRQFAEAVP